MPCDALETMGLRYGLEDPTAIAKRKFRWIFQIQGVSALDFGGQTRALPPRRGNRPSLSWKEQECHHLNETIYYPMKPDWKPIQLQLYDLRCNNNPVFDWVRMNQLGMSVAANSLRRGETTQGLYDPEHGLWNSVVESQFKRGADLYMLDGCGNPIELWTFENCYPQNIEWGELDMDSSDIVTVDITLRYDRAYVVKV